MALAGEVGQAGAGGGEREGHDTLVRGGRGGAVRLVAKGPPGAALLMCTDGLVGLRDRPIDLDSKRCSPSSNRRLYRSASVSMRQCVGSADNVAIVAIRRVEPT